MRHTRANSAPLLKGLSSSSSSVEKQCTGAPKVNAYANYQQIAHALAGIHNSESHEIDRVDHIACPSRPLLALRVHILRRQQWQNK